MSADGTGSGSMSAAQSSPSLVGEVLDGRYRLTKKLGEGGMGEVYAAEHVHIDKKFAVKMLKPEIVSNHEAVVRFQQEARSSSSIKHRNIIAIEDFGKLPDGRIYMCMELLNGQALNDLIQSPQPVDRLLNILIQTGHGLAAAHARNIVHRDMKPENIFVTFQNGEDVPKLLDFGIAKVAGNDGQNNLTRTGTIFGTPFYMAPEQALGNPVDARTDIYAMGVIMYEVFAGSLPFQGESFMGILTQHITTEPEPVAQRAAKANRPLPPGLADIIMRCMQKNPAQRFNTMDELVQALVQVYRGVAGAGMSTYMEAFPHSSQNTPGPMSAAHLAASGQQGAPMGLGATMGVGAPPGVGPSGGHMYPPPPTGAHAFTPPPSGPNAAVAASSSGMYDPSAASSSVVAPKKSSMGLIIAIFAVLAVGGGVAAVVVLGGGKDDKGGTGSGSQVSDNGGSGTTGTKDNGPGPTKDPGSGGKVTTNGGGSGTTVTNNGGGSGTTVTNNGGGSGTTVTNNGGGSGEGSGASNPGSGSGKTDGSAGTTDVGTGGGSGKTDGSGGTVLPPPEKMAEVLVLGSPKNFEIYEDGQLVPVVDLKDHVVKVPEGGEIKITVRAKGYQDKDYTVTSKMRALQVALKANPVPKNPNGNGNPTNVNTGPKCSGTASDLSKNAPPGCRQKFCSTHTDPQSQAMCDAS